MISFLNLNHKEKKILRFLSKSKSPVRLSVITNNIHISKDTVRRTLFRLLQRGLVKRQSIGNRYDWSFASHSDIELASIQTKQTLQSWLYDRKNRAVGNIEYYYGEDKYQFIADSFVQLKNSERYYTFSGSNRPEAAVYQLEKYLLSVHETLAKRKVIIESIEGNDKVHKELKQLSLSAMKSLYGRLTATSIIDDRLLSFDTDFVFVKDQLILIDYSRETVVAMSDPALFTGFMSMFNILKSMSKTFDTNAHILEEIKRREESAPSCL